MAVGWGGELLVGEVQVVENVLGFGPVLDFAEEGEGLFEVFERGCGVFAAVERGGAHEHEGAGAVVAVIEGLEGVEGGEVVVEGGVGVAAPGSEDAEIERGVGFVGSVARSAGGLEGLVVEIG